MTAVPVPDLGIWREWIASIRMERLGRANLVLFLEELSDNPELLDAVHQRLDKDLSLLFYMSPTAPICCVDLPLTAFLASGR